MTWTDTAPMFFALVGVLALMGLWEFVSFEWQAWQSRKRERADKQWWGRGR